jgi:phospholipid-binding lipoprotein MlaA
MHVLRGVPASVAALLCLGLTPFQAAAQESVPAEPPAQSCDPIFDDECEESGLAELAHFPDPWENFNRGSMTFNDGVDTWFFDPITAVYRLLPDPVEGALYRMGLNIDGPAIMINDGLQLEWRDMGTTFSRFLINSSIGLAGLFDPAEALGFERHDSDFGQTLTLAGLPSGPYLIVPVVGPTTVRDGCGSIADIAMNPLVYFFGLASFEVVLQAGGSGIVLRAEKIQELQSLEQGSIDFYAALRSAFYQNRQAEIWGRREHRRDDAASVLEPVHHDSAGAAH